MVISSKAKKVVIVETNGRIAAIMIEVKPHQSGGVAVWGLVCADLWRYEHHILHTVPQTLGSDYIRVSVHHT